MMRDGWLHERNAMVEIADTDIRRSARNEREQPESLRIAKRAKETRRARHVLSLCPEVAPLPHDVESK